MGNAACAMMEGLASRGIEPTTPGCEPDALANSATNRSTLNTNKIFLLYHVHAIDFINSLDYYDVLIV